MKRKRPSRFVVCLSLALCTTLSGLVLFTSLFEVWFASSWAWVERMAGSVFP